MNVLVENISENRPASQPSVQLRYAARNSYAPLIEGISLTSHIAQSIIRALSRLHDRHHEIAPWFTLWREHCENYFDLNAAEEILADAVNSTVGTRLFLAHSYCKIVLTEVVELALGRAVDLHDSASLYEWVNYIGDHELAKLRASLRQHIETIEDLRQGGAISRSDLLASVYQEILPPPLRHLLGEYYTPSWLVEYCINQVEGRSLAHSGPITILDPAAGSGSFLAHFVAHLAATRERKSFIIVGFDVNPLAVDFCRANIMLAASRAHEDGSGPSFDVRVRLTDAVVDPTTNGDGPLFGAPNIFKRKILGVEFSGAEADDAQLERAVRPFRLATSDHETFLNALRHYVADTFSATQSVGAQIIVGNPPWITWDGLTYRYRERVAPQWASSTLVVNTGWRAKVAAGKTDFSSLFVYRAAQRHAAAAAVMVFVLPLSLFQSHLAGAGFRTFQTKEGRFFGLTGLDDFSDVKVFPDAVNRAAVGTFAVGRPPQYPVRYYTWCRGEESGNGQLTALPLLGGPLAPSNPNSPIVAFEQGHTQLHTAVGKSDYRARGGVNTGGANTILWLEVLEERDGLYRVRNVGKSRRGTSPVMVAEVEKDAVCPLLCGVDIHRWKAVPSRSILLLYSPDQPKKALPESMVRSRFPKAYQFLSGFRKELEGRKEYHRWGCSGPFYEVYRIGPYTFSPIKVVWQHTGYRKALNVSVVDDRGRRPTVPDQKGILIPFDNLEEAHYACAFLSSSTTAAVLDRYLGTDASTHILDYIALRRFKLRNRDHNRLADLSVSAHLAASRNGDVAELEKEIDAIVASLLHLA